jgi:hypothetical protein
VICEKQKSNHPPIMTSSSLQLALISSIIIFATSSMFSGLFIPEIEESQSDFAGAWLLSKYRFMRIKNYLNGITSPSSVTFAAIRQKCHSCITLTTRDYFDFLVEHLSPLSTLTPAHSTAIYKENILKLKDYVRTFQDYRINPNSGVVDFRQNTTLAILVYSSTPIVPKISSNLQYTIRKHFFEATFWSVYRYFPHVIVFVASEKDKNEIRAMRLPHWKLVHLAVPNENNRTMLLPKFAIEYLVNLTYEEFDVLYSYDYFYYSEGDQLLYMRHMKDLYDTIDDSTGLAAIVPHRMPVIPIAESMSKEIQKTEYPLIHSLRVPNATIITENTIRLEGSCCDAGRYDISSCSKGHWYQCHLWAIRYMKPLIQLGNSNNEQGGVGGGGIIIPPTTEQKYACSYTKRKRVCALPIDCTTRTPRKKRKTKGHGYEYTKLCSNIPTVIYLGPKTNATVIKTPTSTTVKSVEEQQKGVVGDSPISNSQQSLSSTSSNSIKTMNKNDPKVIKTKSLKNNQTELEEYLIEKELTQLLLTEDFDDSKLLEVLSEIQGKVRSRRHQQRLRRSGDKSTTTTTTTTPAKTMTTTSSSTTTAKMKDKPNKSKFSGKLRIE